MSRSLAAVLLTSFIVGGPTVTMAQKQYCPPCYPAPKRSASPGAGDGQLPSRDEPAPAPGLDATEPSQDRPQAPPGFQQDAPQQAQPTFNTSQPTTAATSPLSAAPNAIGDFFGTGGSIYTYDLSFPYVGPNPAAAGGTVGRQKIGENASPIPRDRVFVNYSLFDDVPIIAGGTTVNRITPGFEKTFLDGDMSFEFRAPFAATVDPTFRLDGTADEDQFEWGDLVFFLKALIYETNNFAFTGGVGFSFPTHDPFVVVDSAGTPLIKVDNNAFHALPFVAALWAPNDRLFVQSFLEIDTDLNGNAVFFDNGSGPFEAGRLQDSTFLFFDAIAGYWVYQNPCGTIRGIAPTVEVHWNRSLSDADVIGTPGSSTSVGVGEDRISILNAIVGVNAAIGDNVYVQAGYGFPLAGADEQFDSEARVSVNWLFGRGNCSGHFCPLH